MKFQKGDRVIVRRSKNKGIVTGLQKPIIWVRLDRYCGDLGYTKQEIRKVKCH